MPEHSSQFRAVRIDEVTRLRESHGWNLGRLAEVAGIDSKTLRRVLKQRGGKIETIANIAKALNVSCDALLDRVEPEPAKKQIIWEMTFRVYGDAETLLSHDPTHVMRQVFTILPDGLQLRAKGPLEPGSVLLNVEADSIALRAILKSFITGDLQALGVEAIEFATTDDLSNFVALCLFYCEMLPGNATNESFAPRFQVPEGGDFTQEFSFNKHSVEIEVGNGSGMYWWELRSSLTEKAMRSAHQILTGEQIEDDPIERMARRLARLPTTPRTVLDLICSGKSTRQISEELDMSTRTADRHRMQLLNWFDVETVLELIKLVSMVRLET